MIRVRYNDGSVGEYKSIKEAQFLISTVLFASNGAIIPEEAVEVMGHTISGVSVERVLNIRLGVVELT
jgi:hypothetical protein